MACYPVFCGPYRCMILCYLTLSGFNSIATNTYVSGLEFLLVFRKYVYIPILETCSSNIFTGKRIRNWESTPSYDDGLSWQDHSEGVSRNKIRYEMFGRWGRLKAECSLWTKDIIDVTQTIWAGWVVRVTSYSPKWIRRGKRHGERRSHDVWGGAKNSHCCYPGKKMCLDKMERYQANYIIVEILNCNGTTGDIIPSSLNIWSLTKCDQPKIMGIYRFGSVLFV